LFLSATPASYELNISKQIVEQIIRPTWLLDPITYVYPKTVWYDELEQSFEELLRKKPRLNDFADGYSLKDDDRKNMFDD
jgi:excinuclease ABC subunit B